MIILGIDPGTATTGWGVVDNNIKQEDCFATLAMTKKLTCLGVGIIKTSPKLSLEQRLKIIFEDLNTLIKKYQPDAVALENLYFGQNSKTALLVGQARGVILLSATLKNIPVFSFTPLQVKIALTGYGRADKQQIGTLVKQALHLEKIPQPDDAADALAIALTYCYSHKFSSKIG